MIAFIVILILLAAGGGLAWFYMSNSGDSWNLSLRMGRYGVKTARTEEEVTDLVTSHAKERAEQRPITRTVERVVGAGKPGRKVAQRLEQADLKWSAGEFVCVWGVVVLVAALIGLLTNGPLGMIGLGLLGAAGPWLYLGHRAKARKTKFLEQLADMAQMMGNSMRAGFSIIQSMEMVALEGPAPSKDEFDRVTTEVKLGLPLDQALDHLLARMPSEDLALAVVAINVQRQVGGNLAEILMVISQTVRGRVRFQRDLKALTAQARYSSWIITGLPIAVAIVINLIDRPYESYLYTSFLGHMMLGLAVLMLGVGFFFLSRISKIEV